MAAILTMVSTAFAARGFLDSCSDFSITNLNGGQGRSMMLKAKCKVDSLHNNLSQLDLNGCFGWTRDACGFTYPPSSGLTNSVGTCTNHYSGGEEHFGANFGCFGPCSGGGTVFNVFALNQYIGNDNGNLVC
ncbi:hypothetical protein KVR01_006457 [Diaporthe batatas]|uniref:uncharacterized protein n=1 Tax=Diaporthe batatas TaxID=748121 RepID=UPI001D046B2F|nr:uncharacterized protein KVR01_006457 [Diaporthe batatas]KAG8164539.1 hypothetical protein KVR01_006457 [Diaporthe batatas]